MSTLLRLFLACHHIPIRPTSDASLTYYRTVARLHGYSLERVGNGRVVFV